MPLTPEEAKERMENLSDREVELLVEEYGELRNYVEGIDDMTVEADSEWFDKNEQQYEAELEEIEDQHDKEEEELQQAHDDQMDKIELETEHALTSLLNDQNVKNNELEDAMKEFYAKLNSAMMKEVGAGDSPVPDEAQVGT